MPLDSKAEKVLHSMQDTYGKEKGKRVFYATANKQNRQPETWTKQAMPTPRKPTPSDLKSLFRSGAIPEPARVGTDKTTTAAKPTGTRRVRNAWELTRGGDLVRTAALKVSFPILPVLDLAGLGMIAAPSVMHFAKMRPLPSNVQHGLELGGLGAIAATPAMELLSGEDETTNVPAN
jgi:hypothetical protein